ncbi:MAG: helix-turn-helix transcriptional regulator [Butyrivibrio sp.]|nr:helix-turn-helix transcriptional regulator [Butyrivibrio sp.]MBP3197883.1 helix-turn-helix transcriptional regulator [Butyrivibrio sp.]
MSDTPLSQYLRLLRTTNEHTQEDLARYLGVTRSTYSHYENARLMPPTDSLYKLSAYYKVSLSKLVRLSVLSSGKGNEDIRAAEYVLSDEDIELQFDTLYKDFLAECSDMSPSQFSKWASIEDREIVYYYHQLSGHDKRLMNYVMKLSLLRDPSESKKK